MKKEGKKLEREENYNFKKILMFYKMGSRNIIPRAHILKAGKNVYIEKRNGHSKCYLQASLVCLLFYSVSLLS